MTAAPRGYGGDFPATKAPAAAAAQVGPVGGGGA